MEENKIIIYQTEDGQTQIDVRLENDTVWLTQAQMAELFQKTPQNITMHIRNAYSEGELEKEVTCKEYLQVQTEGKRTVKRSRGDRYLSHSSRHTQVPLTFASGGCQKTQRSRHARRHGETVSETLTEHKDTKTQSLCVP